MNEQSQELEPKTTSRIKLLPNYLIDQIKAGEVIERPASILKELIENSIDAGATQISIVVIDNGLSQISISDNGKGMTAQELPLAFTRHATSKIDRFDDLYNLHSYGFRGEALASIASVAKVTCLSTPEEFPGEGSKIIIEDNNISAILPFSGMKHGTTLIVENLFFNTPARLNFVKSKNSEKNAIRQVLDSFILSNPEIRFSIQIDDKTKKIFPAIEKNCLDSRIQLLKNTDAPFSAIPFSYKNYKLECWLSSDMGTTSHGKLSSLFVNSRFIQDKQISGLIKRICEKYLGQNIVPDYCLFLTIPPMDIDVNVHPNKTQIKFADINLILSLIKSLFEKHFQAIKENPEATDCDREENDNSEPAISLLLPSSPLENRLPQIDHSVSFIKTPHVLFSENKILFEDQNLLFQTTTKELWLNWIRALLLDPEFSNDIFPHLIARKLSVTAQLDFATTKSYFEKINLSCDLLESDEIVLRTGHKLFYELDLNAILTPLFSFDQKQWNDFLDRVPFENFELNLPRQAIASILETTVTRNINFPRTQVISFNTLNSLQ